MTAFREDGSRVFYVEHVCLNATGNTAKQAHTAANKIVNPNYMVRMFFIGALNVAGGLLSAKPDDFEYVTDMMPFPDKHSSGYTNCPLCGSMGRIKVDENDMVPISEEMTVPITE